MKNNQLKTIGMLMLTGLFLAVLSPADSIAQNKPPQQKGKAVTPVKQYKSSPRRGAHVTALPQKAAIIKHGRYNYHFHEGIFYRPVNSSFVVAAPPTGIRVSVLPRTVFRFSHLGKPYFYYYGVFYIQTSDNNYEVVEAPIGAWVDALPDGYEIFELDSKVYYRLGETYYKEVVGDTGEVFYEVVRV